VTPTGVEDPGPSFCFEHFLINLRALSKARRDAELQKDVRTVEALASAMTPEELRNPEFLAAESRRLRIAQRAGVPIEEAARLIDRFQFMRQFYRRA